MAWPNRRKWKSLGIGLVGLFAWGGVAWGQTSCGPQFVGNPNFCHFTVDESSVPPSPPATDLQKPPQPTAGYPVRFAFIFLCSDFFDGHLLNCGYSVEILKLIDPDPAPDPAFPRKNLGGHVPAAHIPGVHPLIEPKDTGNLIFAGFGGSSGTVIGSPPNPPKMTGNTGQDVAVVFYPTPQASGDLLSEYFMIMPPGYLCGSPGCFDQVPTRFGLNRMQFLTTLRVGVPLDGQLAQTADDPFVLSGQTTAHPENYFGTATAVALIRQIARKYRELNPSLGKLGVNDISLVRGGVYDLNKQWFGDNTKGNGHWGHRTGTEVDIDTTDSNGNVTACESVRGGNRRVKQAVEAAIPEFLIPTVPQGSTPFTDEPISAYLCESQGRNHVYLQ